jgi:hypothetical protein
MGVIKPMSATPCRSSCIECSEDSSDPDQKGWISILPLASCSTHFIQAMSARLKGCDGLYGLA